MLHFSESYCVSALKLGRWTESSTREARVTALLVGHVLTVSSSITQSLVADAVTACTLKLITLTLVVF